MRISIALFSILNNFMITRATDLEDHAGAAQTLGILSAAIFLGIFIGGVVVPVLLSVTLSILCFINAYRVLINKEATPKQRKQAKIGLVFALFAWVLVGIAFLWAFNYFD